MARRFYQLDDDVSAPGRWTLDNPTDARGEELENPWQFTDGRALNLTGRLNVPVESAGRPLDFTLAGFSVPVIHVLLAELFTELAPGEVQLLPVDVDGQPEQFLILVATRLIQCIDDQRSAEVRYWRPEDGLPEKVGQYSAVHGMRIDPARVGEARIFRPEGWPGVLIVSEELKEALERIRATGVKFTEV
ncbi:imm11 family protein [Pyxidicoccus xibeiensis]|uniref:imm11 family protein n=1 Tax=Pyxidicoccus xibeiensis TaxID=2906759 RepID=UPI0020A733BB|nr:DUF1629 domain-containing protein [Pyxidicoccus xibeiensis]MCP3136881.1 hypothetical protein [Pyxidicoccus xibeiensis]